MRFNGPSGKTAGDIMSKELVTVQLTTTLRGLAITLHEHKISGAPVVDEDGCLVGVVSQTDLVRHDMQPHKAGRIVPLHHLDESDLEELRVGFLTEDYGDATVSDIFTPYSVTTAVHTPLEDVAALMVEKGIHRVVVVDGKKVVGIVTSMDILKALASPRPASSRACLVTQ